MMYSFIFIVQTSNYQGLHILGSFKQLVLGLINIFLWKLKGERLLTDETGDERIVEEGMVFSQFCILKFFGDDWHE